MRILRMVLIILLVAFTSCFNDERCDEGHTEVVIDGKDVCLPDYVVGIAEKLEMGDTYYHSKLGVIIYREGRWFNNHNVVVIPDYEEKY